MFGTPKTKAVESEPLTYDNVVGFKSLPLREQVLARSIYAGFRQALREERAEVELGPPPSDLVEHLRKVHKQGSLHPADRGLVCEFDGETWPCRTISSVVGL